MKYEDDRLTMIVESIPLDALGGRRHQPLGMPKTAATDRLFHAIMVATKPGNMMILEVAILDVREGQEQLFEAAFAQASQIIASMDGYVSHEIRRCLERGSRYILLVNWLTLEHHTVGFRGSDEYQEWKRLLHHFYDPFPTVEHYETL